MGRRDREEEGRGGRIEGREVSNRESMWAERVERLERYGGRVRAGERVSAGEERSCEREGEKRDEWGEIESDGESDLREGRRVGGEEVEGGSARERGEKKGEKRIERINHLKTMIKICYVIIYCVLERKEEERITDLEKFVARVDATKEGSTVIMRNAKIDTYKGSMRLAVDRWGRVESTESAYFSANVDCNLSLIEFKLITVKE
ncbi:putative nucleic acid-binding, OB-fold protein [Tanacetum coccineum]